MVIFKFEPNDKGGGDFFWEDEDVGFKIGIKQVVWASMGAGNFD